MQSVNIQSPIIFYSWQIKHSVKTTFVHIHVMKPTQTQLAFPNSKTLQRKKFLILHPLNEQGNTYRVSQHKIKQSNSFNGENDISLTYVLIPNIRIILLSCVIS